MSSHSYDQRRSNYDDRRRGPVPGSSRRDRSRSRSPEDKHPQVGVDDKEAARRARMARLRMENDEEEQKLTTLEEKQLADSSDAARDSKHNPKESIVQVDEAELDGLEEEEQMKLLLGFTGGFGSTKGEKVEDNHKSSARGAAAKNKARKYRQYMNVSAALIHLLATAFATNQLFLFVCDRGKMDSTAHSRRWTSFMLSRVASILLTSYEENRAHFSQPRKNRMDSSMSSPSLPGRF